MIVTLYHCKECFCGFLAKLRFCQVFFAAKKVFACLRLYHANCSCFSLKWKCFPVLFQNCNVLTFFRTGNGFQLFEANHVDLTYIWSTGTFLLFAGNLRSFQLFGIQNCFCYPVFIFVEQELLSWPFLGKLTDFSSIPLKKRFSCFLAKLRCFQLFCTAWSFWSFFRLSRWSLLYLTPKNVFVVSLLNYAVVRFFCSEKGLRLFGPITLIVAVSHSNESYLLFSSKIELSWPFFALEMVLSCSKLITLF